MVPISTAHVDKPLPLTSTFKFPTWKIGLRDLFCPHS